MEDRTFVHLSSSSSNFPSPTLKKTNRAMKRPATGEVSQGSEQRLKGPGLEWTMVAAASAIAAARTITAGGGGTAAATTTGAAEATGAVAGRTAATTGATSSSSTTAAAARTSLWQKQFLEREQLKRSLEQFGEEVEHARNDIEEEGEEEVSDSEESEEEEEEDEEQEEADGDRRKNPFQLLGCAYCQYKATHRNEVSRHMLQVRRKQTQQNTYFTKMLLRGFQVHLGVKPYTCDICGKGFTEKSTLQSVSLRTIIC